MKLCLLIKKLSLLALSGVVLNGCTQGETLIEELASGTLSLINFNGKSEIVYTVTAASPSFFQKGSCDERVSKIEVSINGGAYKALSQFPELISATEGDCSNGDFILEHNNDLTNASVAGDLYFDGTDGQTHTIQIRGLVEDFGVEDFATLKLVFSTAAPNVAPTWNSPVADPLPTSITEDGVYGTIIANLDVNDSDDTVTFSIDTNGCWPFIPFWGTQSGNTISLLVPVADNSHVTPGCTITVSADDGVNPPITKDIDLTINNRQPQLTSGPTYSNSSLLSTDGATVIIPDDGILFDDTRVGTTNYFYNSAGISNTYCQSNAGSVGIFPSTGRVTFTPNGSFTGLCDLNIVLNDGTGEPNATNSVLITIQIDPPTDNPTTFNNPGNLNITEDIAYSENVTLSDVDAPVDSVTVNLVSGDPDCDVLISNSFDSGNQWVTFSANFDNSSSNLFVHPENCQYQIDADQGGNITSGNVSFVLQNAQPSISVTQSSFTLLDSAGVTNILPGANVDSDDEGVGSTTYAIVDDAVGYPHCDGTIASVTINALTGATSVDPVSQGVCDFLIEVNDGSGASNARNWALITINVNAPPSLVSPPTSVDITEGDTGVVSSPLSFTDPDAGDAVILGITDSCPNYDFALNGSNEIELTSAPGDLDVGTDVCSVTITPDDTNGHPTLNDVVIPVNVTNLNPALDMASISSPTVINEDGGQQNIGDVNEPLHEGLAGVSYSVSGSTGGSNPTCDSFGSFSITPDGNLDFTPVTDISGICDYEVSMTDNNSGVGTSGVFTLVIQPDIPTVTLDTNYDPISSVTNPRFNVGDMGVNESVVFYDGANCSGNIISNTYVSGSGTNIQLFELSFATDDSYDVYAEVSLGAGTYTSCSLVPGKYTLDRQPPQISSVEINDFGFPRTYYQEETVQVKLIFNETIRLSGGSDPRISFTAATPSSGDLDYVMGSGKNYLLFEYKLTGGETGVMTIQNVLYDAASIRDQADNQMVNPGPDTTLSAGFVSTLNQYTHSFVSGDYCTMVSGASSWTSYSASVSEGDDGASETRPFKICTADQIVDLADKCRNGDTTACNLHFRLMGYVDMVSATPPFTAPIGGSNAGEGFRGGFDGNNFAIEKLTFSGGGNVGLFGSVEADTDGGYIKNLSLSDFTITASADRSGLLVGTSNPGTGAPFLIDNVWLGEASTISGTTSVGGIIGYANNIKIQNSGTAANITCSGTGSLNCGGLVGLARNATVYRSASKAILDSTNGGALGGLIGGVSASGNADIDEATFFGTISGLRNLGGIVGYVNQGSVDIDNCLAEGTYTQTAEANLGGIVGSSNNGFLAIDNCLSTATLSGSVGVGGIIGNASTGTFSGNANFWDTQLSGVSDPEGTLTITAGATGLLTAQTEDGYTFVNAGWDFSNIWDIDHLNDHPYIASIPVPKDDDELVVFVSDSYTGTGTISTLDFLCETAAGDRSWSNPSEFKAMLGNGSQTIAERSGITESTKIYFPSDLSNPVVTGASNLFGVMLPAGNYFEDTLGIDVTTGNFWSGASGTGGLPPSHCLNWSSTISSDFGKAGNLGVVTTQANWVGAGSAPSCDTALPVLCVGPKKNVSGGGPSLPTGYLVFATQGFYNGNLGGYSGADTICQTEAGYNNLPNSGTYKALIFGDTTNLGGQLPSDIMLGTNGPIVNFNGDTIATNFDNLWLFSGGNITNPVRYDQFGADVGATSNVWTGINSNGSANNFDCFDWTDGTSGNSGRTGSTNPGSLDQTFSTGSGATCNATKRIYCISTAPNP